MFFKPKFTLPFIHPVSIFTNLFTHSPTGWTFVRKSISCSPNKIINYILLTHSSFAKFWYLHALFVSLHTSSAPRLSDVTSLDIIEVGGREGEKEGKGQTGSLTRYKLQSLATWLWKAINVTEPITKDFCKSKIDIWNSCSWVNQPVCLTFTHEFIKLNQVIFHSL